MYETTAELAALQELLDRSLAGATEHLRSIFRPGRTLTAEQAVDVLSGMRTLAVATVTAGGEPRVSGAEGTCCTAGSCSLRPGRPPRPASCGTALW